MPVESPVERAVDALRAAWRVEEARPTLAEAVADLDGLCAAVRQRSQARADEAQTRRLNEIEAQRLRLLNEVARLEARRADAREHLLQDVRRENARRLAEGEEKLASLRADISACETRAQGARAALAEAEQAYAEAEARPLRPDGRIKGPALFVRAGRARAHKQRLPSAGELVSAVRAHLAASGVPLSHDQAVEVLAALTLSPVTVAVRIGFRPQGRVAVGAGRRSGAAKTLFAPDGTAPAGSGSGKPARRRGQPRPGASAGGGLQRPRRANRTPTRSSRGWRGNAALRGPRACLSPPATGASRCPRNFWTPRFSSAWSRKAPIRPGMKRRKRRRRRKWPYRARPCKTSSCPAPRP